MSAQRKDRAMGTGMDLAEAAGTPDFYAVGRLRARVAELEVEVNLLHRQRHAAQEDAANARLLAEARHPALDVVPVPREELEALRSLYSWMSAADEGGVKVSFSLTEFPEGQTCLSGIANALAALDALRAGEAGKGGAT